MTGDMLAYIYDHLDCMRTGHITKETLVKYKLRRGVKINEETAI